MRADCEDSPRRYLAPVRWLLGLTLLVAIAGCGASEQQKVAAAIRFSDGAWDRGEVDEGCSWLTGRARREFLKDSPNPRAGSCREAFEVIEKPPSLGGVTLLAVIVEYEPPRMTRIRVNGDSAVVTFSDGDDRQLRKVDGRWLIDAY